MSNPVLDATRARRAAGITYLDGLVGPASPAATEARSLSTEEAAGFDYVDGEIRRLDAEIVTLETAAERSAAAAAAAAEVGSEGTGLDIGDGKVVIRSEPHTYDQFNSNSYFKDMADVAASHLDAGAGARAPKARERLAQHGKEVVVEAKTNKRIATRLNGVRAELRRPDAIGEFEQRVNPNTTAGQGGEFVPPLWDEARFASYLRAGRVFANRVTNLPLPPGIGVINIPKITLGSQTAIQTANAAAVNSRDMTTTSVSASVNTIAGQEDISLQLLEQSPLSLDGVIQDDLERDYDQQLDLQVIAGSGANGQHLGILNMSGQAYSSQSSNSAKVTTFTCASTVFHDASTAATQYRSIVAGVNAIETLNFSALPPTAIWVHPRRSNSWAYASDSTYRPLFVPAVNGKFNVLGTNEANPVPEGVAGEVFGLPVIKDANMPTTGVTGAPTGGTADQIVVLNESVPLLYEGTLRYRALPEILSGTLQIRFQVYGYSAFLPSRYPTAISVITGTTGLAAPGF